ncbi:MAG: hypothetical protein PHX83_08510 [Acidobacteriia bacterium]|nr:hypothetical protein [Terriglobia bacterium]
MRRILKFLVWGSVGGLLGWWIGAFPAWAVAPTFWEISSFHDFQRGKVDGCSITQEGRVTLAPDLKSIFSTDQVLVWTMASDSKGNLFLGTGHSGKVFAVNPKNEGRLFYTAKELDIFGLAVDAHDNLYVGSSPDGKVFKVQPDGTASEFFNPHSKYIWALAFDPSGTLFVATGDQGKIYKVDPSGKGTLFYETKQTQVMSLAVDPQGNVLAGTFPGGLLFKINAAGKGFVLFDSPLQEVHAITPASDGSIYISCMNEKIQQRFAPIIPGSSIPVAPTTATVTVTPNETTPTVVEMPVEQSFAPPTFTLGPAGGLRSAIYRIAPDLATESLWSSRDEDAFDMLLQGQTLLFSTDSKGRLYAVEPDHRTQLVAQTNEAQVSRLIRRGNEVFAATSNIGKLYQLGPSMPALGQVESEIKDTQSVSRWGVISWQGDAPSGTSIRFFTRSGNSENPDATWSDWSGAYTRSDGEQITSPAARFIQWKGELRGSGQAAPSLDLVSVAYLPQNVRPVIQSVKVTPQGLPPLRHPAGSAEGSSSDVEAKTGTTSVESPGTITVTAFASPTLSRSRVTLSWQAEDKDHDIMEYSVYLRGLQEKNWRLLKKDLRESSYGLDPETLPDGKYRFKVVASDALSNPAGAALTTEMESEVFTIDNTPPKVEPTGQSVDPGSLTVHFRASDEQSPLRRAEYALDSGRWQMLTSDDGLVDSKFEEFTVHAEALSPGEHVVTLRVYDSSGNPGLAKAVVTVEKK